MQNKVISISSYELNIKRKTLENLHLEWYKVPNVNNAFACESVGKSAEYLNDIGILSNEIKKEFCDLLSHTNMAFDKIGIKFDDVDNKAAKEIKK